MTKVGAAIALVMVAGACAPGAVFQYGISVESTKGARDAFMWVPAEAAEVRGVVMGGMTLAERELAKDKQIRRACADAGLAIVFLKCGLGQVDVQEVLDRFAEVSGYREISKAPLLFVGHSAGGPGAKSLAIEMRERCFGLVQYRGGVPGGGETAPAGVPVLMMIGQFDEFGRTMRNEAGRETWMGGRDAMAAFRAADERNLGSVVVEPGAGHFAWSDRNAAYLAMFIAKAAKARIGDGGVRQIDHRGGWLTDLAVESEGAVAAAAWGEYAGDRSKAGWHFDEEMAAATIGYHEGLTGKEDQFIRWADPHWVDAGARFFFTKLEWVGDGRTIRVHPVYGEEYPGQYNGRGPVWVRAGEAVGHSDSPIRVKVVGGPVVATGADTLQMRYDGLAPATEKSRVTFMAYSEGDERYRYTEHIGMMPRGFGGLTKGKEQRIRFDEIGDMKVGAGPVRLRAESDSGLEVEFYVAYGPAVVVGDRLSIAELPVRAECPIEVKVVAYQFGSGVEPLVKTAEAVERVLRIVKR